ncbi:hypothetical protein GIB67_032894 [Kingdonia uniflora]|uniref:Uncharacterized protein n=1 Tax=Kingdonia uniflora TaxID=39325 RepID=A0A7J7KV64_9MAGN|nr:hypothetical protein GIB67_032894 [Kingdonia uniflora]
MFVKIEDRLLGLMDQQKKEVMEASSLGLVMVCRSLRSGLRRELWMLMQSICFAMRQQ